ncbi:MAG: ATP-binding protein [Eubacterium sp.]|nr:ATP-binding protein [Eubacterium sp.]
MGKRITIYQGDEYKAKIAEHISADDLFAEQYMQTFSVLEQMILELSQFKNRQKEQKESMNGMGNNILVFSGQRGQGKTSFMQSVAKWLKEDISAEDILMDDHCPKEWKKTVKNVKEHSFVVLDSIDPSSLAKEESVLQVLLTRLFYLFDKKIKSECSYGMRSDREKVRMVNDITPFFRKCFKNIDYLKLGREKDWGIDNLEDLAQISSSAAFKENLQNLPQIEKIIHENPESISFCYMNKNGKNLLKLRDQGSVDAEGIYVQLVKILYSRTGMLFCSKEVQKILFPRKMRELTHLVKLLSEMNDVVCDEVYRTEDLDGLASVRQNINIFSQYFFDYWCTKNLSPVEKDLLEKLDLAFKSHDEEAILSIYGQITETYKKQGVFFSINFKGPLGKIFSKVLSFVTMTNMKVAMKAVFTMFVNLWFLEIPEHKNSVSERRQIIQSIKQFTAKGIYAGIPDLKENHIPGISCEISEDEFFDERGIINTECRKFIDLFCDDADADGKLEFNLLNPIWKLLYNLEINDVQMESNSMEDTDNSEESSQGVDAGNADYLISVRNVVADYDVQSHVAQAIYDSPYQNSDDQKYTDFIAAFYQKFQFDELESYGFVNTPYNIPNILRKYVNMYHRGLEEIRVQFIEGK